MNILLWALAIAIAGPVVLTFLVLIFAGIVGVVDAVRDWWKR